MTNDIYALGCDISRWQDDPTTPEKVDFDQMRRAGASFVFLKASQAAWMDRTFPYHYQAAKDAGLLVGLYHFLTWESIATQADFFTRIYEDHPSDLPPICDFEWWNTTPKAAVSYLRLFLTIFYKNIDVFPGLYTSPAFWQQYGDHDPIFRRAPLWIAHWFAPEPTIPKPWVSWTFWQHTNKGHGPTFGVESQQIDLNYYNGRTVDLLNTYGSGQVVKPDLSDAEKLSRLWDAHKEIH